jgi:hypothetical protein
MQIHEVTAGQIKAGAKKIGTGAWNAAKNAGSAVGSAVGDELERLAFGSTVTDYSQAAQPARPKDQGPTDDQYAAAEKTRLDKQAAAAKAAQDQMVPFSKFQPAAGTAPRTQMATTTPGPEVLDPLVKPAQRYTGINNNNVIDVDARVVPDPTKAATLPKPAATLPKPAATLPKPAAKLPAPVTPAPGAAAFGQMAQQLTTKPAATPAPKVNPAAAPVPYMFDGRKLNPSNPNDARIIAALQAQGVTSATTAQVKKQGKRR